MRRGLQVGCVAAAIVSGVLCGAAWTAFRSNTVGQRGITPIEASSLEFGDVWAQQDFAWEVIFKNRSDFPVHLSNIRGTCTCTKVTPENVLIPPGGVTSISLTINLLQGHNTAAVEPRPFSVGLYATSDASGEAPGEPLSWTITGMVRNALLIHPRVGAGEIRVDQCPQTIEVPVRSQVALRRIDVTTESVDAIVEAVEIPARDRAFVLCATFPRSMQKGELCVPVVLTPIREDGSPLPECKLLLCVERVGDYVVLPKSVDLGFLRAEAVINTAITIRSRSGSSFIVEDVKMPVGLSGQAQADRTEEAVEAVVSLIDCRLDSSGMASSVIQLRLRNTEGDIEIVQIPFSAYSAATAVAR